MDFALYLPYALTIAALAIKPGPGVLAVVSKTAGRGMAGFSSYMSGATLGEVIYLAVVVYGFAYISQDIVFLSLLLKAMTGAYLIYLGIKTLNESVDISGRVQASSGKNNWDDFSTGLMLTLSNPFVIVVFAGIVPTVIDTGDVRIQDFLVLAAITVVVQIAIDFMYCFPVLVSRQFFTPKILNGLRLASGVVMVGLGLYLGYSALPAQDLKAVF